MANASLCELDQIDLGSYTALARRVALGIAAATAFTAQIAGASGWSQDERAPTAFDDDAVVSQIPARVGPVSFVVDEDVPLLHVVSDEDFALPPPLVAKLPFQFIAYNDDDLPLLYAVSDESEAALPPPLVAKLPYQFVAYSDDDLPVLYVVSDEGDASLPPPLVARVAFQKIAYSDDDLPLLYTVTDGDDALATVVPATKQYRPWLVTDEDYAHAAVSDDEDLQLVQPPVLRPLVPSLPPDSVLPMAASLPPALEEDWLPSLVTQRALRAPSLPTDDDPPLTVVVAPAFLEESQLLAPPVTPRPITGFAIDDESVPYFVSDEDEAQALARPILARAGAITSAWDPELPPVSAPSVFEDDWQPQFLPAQRRPFILLPGDDNPSVSARITVLAAVHQIVAPQRLSAIQIPQQLHAIVAPVRLKTLNPTDTITVVT